VSGVISEANMNAVVKIFIGPYTSSGYYTPTESRTPEAAAQDRLISAATARR
jgi:hypothetical protein